MKARISAFGAIVLLFATPAYAMSNGLYTVYPNQLAVVFRGKTAVRVSEPGLHFYFPLFESVEFFSIAQQRTEIVFSQSCQKVTAGSSDGDFKVHVIWYIRDPIAYIEADRPSDTQIEAVARPLVCDIGIPTDLENKSLVKGFEKELLGTVREAVPGIHFGGVVAEAAGIAAN